MAKSRKAAIAVLAGIGLLQAPVAFAQDCIAKQDLTDATIYAVPVLIEGFQATCSAHLAPNGFFAKKGKAFVAPYAAMQADRWPGTMRAVMAFATKGGKQADDAGMTEIFQSMPPETLRPFVDAILSQKFGESLKPSDCGKVERAMELLAPLPPENVGGLLTFVLDMTGAKEPSICQADSR